MPQHTKAIVLASDNAGKLRELQPLCTGLGLKLASQSDFQVSAPAETGQTFLENALSKARHCTATTGLSSLADDSGLIVPALAGAPGVYSARYAGKNASDGDNVRCLIDALKGYAGDDRSAYFHCTLVFLRDTKDPDPLLAQGRWYGHIASQPQGRGGFGYDPVFICDRYQVSAAELELEVKNSISHRGMAMRALANCLRQIGGGAVVDTHL